jgi:peptidyl-prolyl cis-trans isomerase SurA
MIRRTPLHRLSFPAVFRKPLCSSLLAFATIALGPGLYAQAAPQNSAQSLNATAAAPDEPYHGAVVEQVVAQVNDQIISTSDYKRAEQELEQQASQQNWPQDKLEAARGNLLRDLIDNQLLLSKGKQLGITGEAETIREMDQIRKQNHLDSMEALEDAVAKQGLNFADFKASIQNRIITSQVIRDQVGRRINITQPDERAYYDAHKSEFTTPESVKLSEILIPTTDPDNTTQVDEAQKKADAIEAQLKSGADFADLAKKDSGGSTAAQGGLLGEYTSGQLAKVLEDDTFSLDAGQYTAPIRTKQGFIILRVDAHKKAEQQSFDDAENQVQEAIGMQKMQPALRAYLKELRDEAYIEVRPGYIDSAATQNEVHPSYSAYQAPHKKKKKKRTLVRYGEATQHRGRTRTNFGMTHKDETATAVAPSNVPSLADIANNNVPPAESAKDKQKDKKQEARSMKPGRREKVRFGQAPRETLPPASHDADAAGSQVAGADQAQPGYQADNDESQAQPKKNKVRYSSQAFESHAAKKKRKVADQKQQDQPLGLAGDTSKKKKKPKPTEKTRYSSEAYDKKAADKNPPPPTSPGPNTPAAPQITPDATPQATPQSPQN